MTQHEREAPIERSSSRSRLDVNPAEWVIIILITAYGIFLRKLPLNPSSLWLDDAWVALSSRLSWSAVGEVGLTSIGFTAAIKLVGSNFGPSSIAFQSVPFFFGVAAPVVAFVALRRRIHWSAAALVAFMISVSPVIVIYSTRVKQYTFDAFAAVLLISLALAVIDDPGRRRSWARFVTASIFAAIVSSIAFVTVAGCAMVIGAKVLIGQRSSLPETLKWGAVLTSFTGLYWVLFLGDNLNATLLDYWVDFYIETDEGFSGFVGDTVRLSNVAFDEAAPFGSVGAAWIIFGFSALTLLIRARWVLLLGVAPLAITVALSAFELAPFGGGRTDSFWIVGLFIIVGFAVDEWIQIVRHHVPQTRLTAGPLISGVLALVILQPIEPIDGYPAQNIRPLVTMFEEKREPDDGLLLYYASVWSYGLYSTGHVALAPIDEDLRLFTYDVDFGPEVTILGNRRDEEDQYEKFVEAVTRDRDRVWFISSHYRSKDLEAVASFFTASGFRLDQVTLERGAQLTLWVREEP